MQNSPIQEVFSCELVGGPFDGSTGVVIFTSDGEMLSRRCARVYNPQNPYGITSPKSDVLEAVYEWDGQPRSWDADRVPYRFLFVGSYSWDGPQNSKALRVEPNGVDSKAR